MKQELTIKHEGNVAELVIREGAALEAKPPRIIEIIGTITAISIWLTARLTEIVQKNCFITVNKDALEMTLFVDEKNYYRTVVQSKLQLSKEFISFGINSEMEWECFQLSDFIKMNRTYFPDKVMVKKLITDLRNFKAKVQTETDKFKDDRANFELRKKQVVESNLPEDMKIKIPVFKGQPAVNLTLEISIDPNTFACSFICPEATDYINEQTDLIFDEQIAKIKEIAPDIAIIYI